MAGEITTSAGRPPFRSRGAVAGAILAAMATAAFSVGRAHAGCPADCNGHGSLALGLCVCNLGYRGLCCTECAPGFWGYPHCTLCTWDACNGHGDCDDSGGCLCDPGYGGPNCDQCAPDYYGYPNCTYCNAETHCHSNGTCDDLGQCLCDPGFTGSACDMCEPGRYGPDCQECPGGAENPCNGNGLCLDGISGTGQCLCTRGFLGPDCSECAPGRYGPTCMLCPGGMAGACHGHGTCDEGISGTGVCTCDPGWTGPDCSVPCGDDFDGDSVGDFCDDDIDGDGVLNAEDVCDYTPPGVIVGSDGTPRADLDMDCDVDLADYALFQAAFSGPGG